MHSIINSQQPCTIFSNPRDTHIQALKHMMHYIKVTFYGIKYHKYDFGKMLHGFSDAIWARGKNT